MDDFSADTAACAIIYDSAQGYLREAIICGGNAAFFADAGNQYSHLHSLLNTLDPSQRVSRLLPPTGNRQQPSAKSVVLLRLCNT